MSEFMSLFKERRHLLLVVSFILAGLGALIIFAPYAITIILAGIFSLFFALGIKNLHAKYKTKLQKCAFVAGTVLAIGVVTLITVHATLRIYAISVGEERSSTVAMAKNLKQKINNTIESTTQKLGGTSGPLTLLGIDKLSFQTNDLGKKAFASTMTFVADFFSSLTEITVSVLIFFLMLYVFVSRRVLIYEKLLETKTVSHGALKKIVQVAQNSSYSMIFSNFIVGIMQATIMTVGAYIVGLTEWSVVFFLSFICSLLPMLGTAPIGILLSVICLAQDNTVGALTMIGFSVLAGIIDNVARPYLVAKSEKDINTAVALVGIIGAVVIFGFAGLFIGPFVLSFVVGSWPLFKKAFFEEPAMINVSQRLYVRPYNPSVDNSLSVEEFDL